MKVWRKLLPTIVALALVGLVWGAYVTFFASSGALIVYCAHDATYSRAVLDRFTEQTGIKVLVKDDTEATKSLGLVELILKERSAPRCDVFWNNELLGMIQLQEAAVLEPWKGAGYRRIPDNYKDPNGEWCGFAARVRVYILNSNRGTAQDAAAILNSDDLSRTAIAKPLYGTTLTHYSALWHQLGRDVTREWHLENRRKGMKEVNGNAITKDLVANGVCDLGFTDTDDFFVAKDSGAAVAMVPARLPDGATICIPNTVAVIRGTRHQQAARKLVDFLLSEENELALANSASRQLPLGAVDASRLPEEVRAMLPWLEQGRAPGELAAAREECLKWLKSLDD